MLTEHTNPTFLDRNRILIKGFLVGFLILIMLIPSILVGELVRERQTRQQEVVNEVSGKWAGQQTLTGPVLMLPYIEHGRKSDGTAIETVKTAFILPDEMHISGNMQPTEKKRGLYSVMLYRSVLQIAGKFNKMPLTELQIDEKDVIWKDAKLVVNIGDMRGVEEQVQLDWNGNKLYLDAGVPNNKLLAEGISAPVTVNAQGASSFSIKMNLRGSDRLYFTPVGKTTEVDVHANWKDPAFDGQYLPATTTVNGKGFNAHWKILPLSHNYPQFWLDETQDLGKAAFGVRLIQPVDGYFKTNRAVKYALLFIALTFTFFFFLEILQKRQVHPIQYLLVGFALTVFYTLLLSISEYTGFNIAYLIASVATISLISVYAWSVFKSLKTAGGFTFTLSALYGYIFMLIQSEDYALLFGSIGLFIIIAIIMYYSRKIDWYSTNQSPIVNSTGNEPNMH